MSKPASAEAGWRFMTKSAEGKGAEGTEGTPPRRYACVRVVGGQGGCGWVVVGR